MVHSCWRIAVAVMAVTASGSCWTNAFVHFHSSLVRPSTLPQHKTTTPTTSSRLHVGGLESLFPSLGNLGSQQDDTNNQDDDDGAFEATPLGLIRQARRMVASDFGILDPSLLADDNQFVWIGPYVDEPLGKLDYIAAGRFFDLRAAFPDLEYRPHDFRIDESNPWTIRVTCRVTGTMRGALRLRDGTLPPTGKRWLGPPETISMTFTPLGKVQKLCTGFCMDRQVGNTKGSTGVLAAALVAGQALSDWDLYPAPAVWNRFFGRPIAPLLESKSVLAPFPETVMIQLAKGILATTLASQDPSLLSDDQFEFWTPYVGPINKASFLENYAVQEFESVDPAFSHFRVDPYDPVRVWVDVVPTGPGYQGCPQAMSFVLDEEGFCTRITSSYVLDPSMGNGGGLGGPEGYRYATGQATLDVWTRPWSRVVGRVRKQVLSPLTGVGVDDYVTSTQARSASNQDDNDDQSLAKSPPPPTPPSQLPPPSAVVTNTASASERLSGLRAAAGMAVPPPPSTTKKLKQQGAQEAASLKAQLEAAQARALQARAQLAALVQDSTIKAAPKAAPKAPSPSPPPPTTMAPEPQRQQPQQQQAAAAAQQQQQQQEQQQQAAAEQRRAQLQAEREAAAAARREELQVKRQEAQRKRQAFLESVAQVKQADAQKLAQERATKVQAQKAAAAARQEQVQAQKAKAERQRVAAAVKKQQLEEQKAEAARQRVAAAAAKKQQLEEQKAEAARKRVAAAAAKKQQLEDQKAEAARKRAAAAAAKKQQLEEQKAEAARKRAAAAETQRAALAAKRKLAATQKAVEAKQKQRQALKAKSAAAAAKKSTTVEQDDSEARRARQQAALESLSNAVQRATISLFGVVGFGDDDESSSASSVSSSSRSIPITSGSIRIPKPATASKPVKKAAAKPMAPPKGVPVLKRWRKTPTGAVTGIISGSRNFEDGDRVTTSPITTGTIAPGQLVRTGSGSRYFLS